MRARADCQELHVPYVGCFVRDGYADSRHVQSPSRLSDAADNELAVPLSPYPATVDPSPVDSHHSASTDATDIEAGDDTQQSEEAEDLLSPRTNDELVSPASSRELVSPASSRGQVRYTNLSGGHGHDPWFVCRARNCCAAVSSAMGKSSGAEGTAHVERCGVAFQPPWHGAARMKHPHVSMVMCVCSRHRGLNCFHPSA